MIPAVGGLGVYIHTPFCASRCKYCDFNTYAGIENLIPAYFDALQKEMAMFFAAPNAAFVAAQKRSGDGSGDGDESLLDDGDGSLLEVETVFFGGGTPSFVDAGYIARTLDIVGRRASRGWECSIEANPGTVSPEKLAIWRRAGANRLSVGLQSTDDRVLLALGRRHTYEDFLITLREARRAGFDNISADLLFGLPGQTARDWEKTLVSVLGDADLKHISCYSLSVEEGTPLARDIDSGAVPAPDEDADREMYAVAKSVLAKAGLAQYELSNFAVPGYECAHNIKYWTGAPYRGFGAGAASFDGSRRFGNARGVAEYIAMIGAVTDDGKFGGGGGVRGENGGARTGRTPQGEAWTGRMPQGGAPPDRTPQGGTPPDRAQPDEAAVVEREAIDAREKEREFLILRLRLTDGFSLDDYRERFGREFLKARRAPAEKLIDEGLLEITGAGADKHRGQRGAGASPRARLTSKGMDLANRAFVEFI